MATQILQDCTLWLNQFDITADTTQLDATREFDEKESTTFASGGKRERKAGIEDSKLDFMTFWDPALAETNVLTLQGTSNNVLSATVDGSQGSRAYFTRGELLKVNIGLPVGEMAKLDSGVATSSAEGIVRGSLLTPKATRTTTANGTGVQEGAVTSTQKVYALAQVFSIAGTGTPTLALKIQSDDNSGFTTPTDRITFTNFTAVGYQLSSLAGAITDDYWRAVWTITGTSPQIAFGVCIGIR